MKSFFFNAAVLSVIIAASCLVATKAEITYPGTGTSLRNPYDMTDFGTEMQETVNMPNSLFPAPNMTDGNVIKVNGTSLDSVGGHVYGAITKNGVVENNTVNINSGTIGSTAQPGSGNVTGGWIWEGISRFNKVYIGDETGSNDVTIRNIIFGGWAQGGVSYVDNNNVVVNSDAILRNNIYGGYNQGSGHVVANIITIDGGTLTAASVDIIAGGYSGITANDSVQDNKVNINNGTITNAAIYGGRGQSSTHIIGNEVNINDGTITNTSDAIWGGQGINSTGTIELNKVNIKGGTITATIYGGGTTNSGRGIVTKNTVDIGGSSKVTGDVYGGYSNAGSATLNTVTIGIDDQSGTFGSVLGGHVRTGTGDVFTGNIFNKKASANIETVQNFQKVFFDYADTNNDGDANIGTLYTHSTNGSGSGVTLDVADDDDITFNQTSGGDILGTGSLTKTGKGTLIMGGDLDISNALTVSAGTLQIGTGSTTGSLDATQIAVAAGATLAFDRSNDVIQTQAITGGGKVIQRGSGTLTLDRPNNAAGLNTFTGGTEIESGTLNITDGVSYNRAQSTASDAGYITFTGTTGTKTANVETDNHLLYNSFRTAENTDGENIVNINNETFLHGVNIKDNGGAFYVASDTTLNVNVNANLHLGNVPGTNYQANRANGQANDIYVGDSAILLLSSTGNVNTDIASGIAGNGGLVISSKQNTGLVNLYSGSTYKMGSTSVSALSGGQVILNMARANQNDARITFENTNSFTLNGNNVQNSAVLTGGGIIDAPEITIRDGAVLAPFKYDDPDDGARTLTLKGADVTLNNFILASQVGYTGNTSQNPLTTDREGIPMSNNDLLYIDTRDSGNPGNAVSLTGDNLIVLRTVPGRTFTEGDYLLVKTTNGFKDSSNVAITNDTDLQDLVDVNIDGFELGNTAYSPRGTYELRLGDDPDTSGDWASGTNNIWLKHELNSLTMDISTGGTWDTDNEDFLSLQKGSDGTTQEKKFLSGDKVHVTGGTSGITLDLPTFAQGSKITVSGLVAGQDSDGDNSNTNVTFTEDGGFYADRTSAFGEYVNNGDPDDELTPTGMLQKYGTGTLTFENLGGNMFMEGVELHGGTIAFNLANQLNVETGNAITFVENAALQANDSVTLDEKIVVKSGIEGEFNVAKDGGTDKGLFLTGNVGGTGNIEKTGDGVLQFNRNTDAANQITDTTVSGGKFRVVTGATYNSTGTFTLDDENGDANVHNAELSGGGTIIAQGFVIKDRIASDTTIMDENRMVSIGNERFATITLQGTGVDAETTFENFVFDYRISPTSTGPADLLKLTQMSSVALKSGTINIMTDGFNPDRADYLIIDSNVELALDSTSTVLDGITNSNGIMKATLNGTTLTNNTPRGGFVFERRLDNTQLWLTVENNTLETHWKGTDDATWDAGAWESVQETEDGDKDDRFMNGDLVYFHDDVLSPIDYSVNINRVVNVSGMEVETAQTVTFTGNGGVESQSKSGGNRNVVGVYADSDSTQDQRFDTTGMLIKKGAGTLVFENTGGNTFGQGIEIQEGTIGFNDVAQLGVGAGKEIKFNATTGDDAALRFDADGLAFDATKKITITDGQGNFEVGADPNNAANLWTGLVDHVTGTNGTMGKTGEGTLVVTGDTTNVQQVKVEEGTLQLGNGGTNGGIDTATNGIDVASGAKLAYKHSNNVSEGLKITGAGTVIQRGSGTLSLEGANTFTGGTEIESGTLLANITGYNKANGGDATTESATSAGFITFTGADSNGEKNVIVAAQNNGSQNNVSYTLLTNSFRTDDTAGHNNIVSFTDNNPAQREVTAITGVNIDADGGAFYVAGNSEMTVNADALMMAGNTVNSTSNDIFVDAGGTLNLNATLAGIGSGTGGTGTLNLATKDTMGLFKLSSDGTYDMGTTNVKGIEGHAVMLDINRTVTDKITFNHSDSFNMSADYAQYGAILAGDGTIKAANAINITEGSVLTPMNRDSDDPHTLALEVTSTGADVTLEDFMLFLQVSYPNSTNGDLSGNANPKNDMLDITTQGTAVKLQTNTMEKNEIQLHTADGSAFKEGDYLLIRTNHGFEGMNTNDTDANDAALNSLVGVSIDGIALGTSGSDSPRGEYALKLGADPGSSGEYLDPSSVSDQLNVWLTTDLNSLTMTWDGGGTEREPVVWGNGNFDSLQETTPVGGTPVHEHQIMSGDKVHLVENAYIELPGATSSMQTGQVYISGLVAGKAPHGKLADGKNYTFTGTGGITTDAHTAFGDWTDDDTHSDPENTGTGDRELLTATSKLEKFGTSTLTFANTGGNNFKGGIELSGGKTRFNLVSQLGDSDGAGTTDEGDDISFLKDTALEAYTNLTLFNNIDIATNVTGSLEANGDTVFTYSGASDALTGDGTLDKSGTGKVILDTDSGFTGGVSVSAGTLDVVGNYGGTTALEVKNGGTLRGTGTVGSGAQGRILSGGILAPGGLTDQFADASGIPREDPLNINGGLIFDPGSIFNVGITQYGTEGIREPFADQVNVNGRVDISPTAKLNVTIDYWGGTQAPYDFNAHESGHFTVIDASAGTVGNTDAQFTLTHSRLPRGVQMMQGWEEQEFNLWFELDPNNGFNDVCYRNNRVEIGTALDWFVTNYDPNLNPAIQSLIDRLSMLGDAELCNQLDKITGDIGTNVVHMAMDEAWQSPFNRVSLDDRSAAVSCDPCAAVVGNVYQKRNLWGEFTGQHLNAEYDDNATPFSVDRTGVAIGVDRQITPNAVLGATFQYGDPRLSQATGTADMDDYEFGLYGMTRLPQGWEMKGYLGYGNQSYKINRSIYLPFTQTHASLHEELYGKTSGDSLSASLEFVRPERWSQNLILLPTLALDYQKAWMAGYQETGGDLALVYGKNSLERLMFRFGLGGKWQSDRLTLSSRLQYAFKLNPDDEPNTVISFLNGGADQYIPRIQGHRIGDDYVNWGLGLNFQRSKTLSIFTNYDVKWYDNAVIHIGDVGVTKTW